MKEEEEEQTLVSEMYFTSTPSSPLGAAILKTGLLVFCFFSTKLVKLVETERQNLKSQIEWNICKVNKASEERALL